MAGANWPRIPLTRKAMPRSARTGKKLRGEVDQIVTAWGNDRPLRLMFQDEARFGRISDTRYCGCRRPLRPLVSAMVTQQYTYAYGAASPRDGRFDSLVLPQVNAGCMQIFLDEIARRYPNDNIVMVLDGAGWHKRNNFHLGDTIFACCFSLSTRPNLIPRSTFGTNCVKSIFTTGSSRASMLSKITWSSRYAISKTTPIASNPSPDGTGLLMPVLMRIRIRAPTDAV